MGKVELNGIRYWVLGLDGVNGKQAHVCVGLFFFFETAQARLIWLCQISEVPEILTTGAWRGEKKHDRQQGQEMVAEGRSCITYGDADFGRVVRRKRLHHASTNKPTEKNNRRRAVENINCVSLPTAISEISVIYTMFSSWFLKKLPMDVNGILDAPIAHGHNKRPIILIGGSRGQGESDVGEHVVVKDSVDGFGIVTGMVLLAADLVDSLVVRWCVICHPCWFSLCFP